MTARPADRPAAAPPAGPRPAGRLVWSAAVLAAGTTQLAAGWAGPVPVAVFLAAIVLTHGVVLAARAVGISAGLTAIAVPGAAVGAAYWVTGASTPGALGDLVPRLLTAPRPAPATPELLLPGVLLVIVVALVAALWMLGDGRALVAPAAGAAVLYTAGALLTAGRADRHGLVALGMVALLSVGWTLGGRSRGRLAHLVPPAALIGPVASVTLLAGVFPAADAFEPRELVTPPISDLSVPSPLPQLATLAAAGDTELFRVRGPEVPVRLVALADYTGSTWRAASLYGPIGAVAPPDLPEGASTADAALDVTIGALTGPWLPTAGRPKRTSGEAAEAVVDPDSGSLVLPARLRPGLRYTVLGTVDTPADSDLLTAPVPAERRYLALPGLPFSLAEYARRTVASARTPFERAVAIEEVVRTGRRTDAQAPVGSSYARLETFLFGAPGAPGAGTGTAEQFASAFAVLARAVGLPSRVVVGFRPVPAGRDGVAVVRASDATAWPEVYFTGRGWVALDPTPGTGTGPGSPSKREVINRLATPTPPVTTTGPPELAKPVPPAPPGPAAGSGGNPWRALLVLAFLPLAALAALGTLRTARRLRLRRAGPTGAWSYVLDSLLLAGRPPARHRPAPDIATELAGFAPAAVTLAALADRAAFAPDPPPPGPSAWPLARQVRAGLRRATPWYRRLFWPVDPRPLWRR